MTPTKDTVLIN